MDSDVSIHVTPPQNAKYVRQNSSGGIEGLLGIHQSGKQETDDCMQECIKAENVDGPVLVNNDRVLLESKTFRLNYTAKSADAHKFLVVVEDNFGSTPWEQTFEFNGKDKGDDNGGTIIGPVVGPVTPIVR